MPRRGSRHPECRRQAACIAGRAGFGDVVEQDRAPGRDDLHEQRLGDRPPRRGARERQHVHARPNRLVPDAPEEVEAVVAADAARIAPCPRFGTKAQARAASAGSVSRRGSMNVILTTTRPFVRTDLARGLRARSASGSRRPGCRRCWTATRARSARLRGRSPRWLRVLSEPAGGATGWRGVGTRRRRHGHG